MINKTEFLKYFKLGEKIPTGGRRSTFELINVDDKKIRIAVGGNSSPSYPKLAALSVVVQSFDSIDPQNIQNCVDKLLTAENLTDHTNETYLYGLAREYRERSGSFSFEQYQEEYEKQALSASKLPTAALAEKAKKVAGPPKSRKATTQVFIRNPFVAEYVKRCAHGICQCCGEQAPFISKKNRMPYLEVHHKTPLAQGGDDSVENSIALCPNCHRKMHFG